MVQTPITELDFFQIKEQLKAFLKGQSRFRDYDFEGANISVLLDVLAYNTYQNNFYTNMAINEMFLDSAVMRSSVMSHAKELNYLPKSRTSSKAEVNLRITAETNNAASITLPSGHKFYTTHNGSVFNFYTNSAHIIPQKAGTSNIYEITCVPIYEGELVEEIFYLSENISSLNISNEDVDISSVRVFLNNRSEEYLYKTNIFGVQPDDKVFYIEPTLAGGYGVTFGKNIFGKEPAFNEDITITYRVASGSAPNGAVKFSTSFTYPTSVSTYTSAIGGGERETVENVKYFAPKSIQNQERAVTAQDYETLLKKEFGNSVIKSVSVYGGDQLNPPRYGKVAISINPYDGTTISDSFKTAVILFLSDKTPLPIQPVFVDPQFLFAKTQVTVYFSRKLSSKSNAEIELAVREAIQTYSNTYLNDFGSVLQLSRLSKIIDDIDTGILSNTIESNPIIDYSPQLYIRNNPQFEFESSLIKPYPFDVNENISSYIPAVESSIYKYNGVDTFFQDDGRGNILTLSTNLQTVQVINPVIGTVDYTNGIVRLVDFSVDSYPGTAIKIYANTSDKNISAPKNRVLSIRDVDVTVSVIERS